MSSGHRSIELEWIITKRGMILLSFYFLVFLLFVPYEIVTRQIPSPIIDAASRLLQFSVNLFNPIILITVDDRI